MIWSIEIAQDVISHLLQLEKVLNTMSFYETYREVFVAYGKRKRHWWNALNAQRIQQDTIDGESIETIMHRLQRYDSANGFVRFIQRLFTPIEHQRNLVCYWAVNRLREQLPSLSQTLSSDMCDMRPTSSASTLLRDHQTKQTFQALSVLRLQTPYLKSKTLRKSLSHWNLIPVLREVMPIFNAWMLQLSALWRRTIMSTSKQSSQKIGLMPLQELSLLLSSAACNLRATYLDVNLNLTAREKVIKTIYQRLKNDYNALLITTSAAEQPELSEVYQSGIVALQTEQERYISRLKNPASYLKNSEQKAYIRKLDLSLEQQWLKQDRLELDIRFEMAKKLFHQAWLTTAYEQVKGAVHQWLNSYLYPLFRSYLEPLREASTLEARSHYQTEQQALYQQIQAYLQIKIANLLAHETNLQTNKASSSQTQFAINPNVWLQEWSALMTEVLHPIATMTTTLEMIPVSPSSAIEASHSQQEAEAIKVSTVSASEEATQRAANLGKTVSEKTTVKPEPKTAAEWRMQCHSDIEDMKRTQNVLEIAIRALIQKQEMEQAKTKLITGLEQMNKTYRELARRYHPDRWTEESIHDLDQDAAKMLASELFKKLTEQKQVFIASLEHILSPSNISGPTTTDSAWVAACMEKIKEMDTRISNLFKDFSQIRAEQERIAAAQARIKEELEIVKSEQAENAKDLTFLFLCEASREKRTANLERKLEQAQQLFNKLESRTSHKVVSHAASRGTFLSTPAAASIDTSKPQKPISQQASTSPAVLIN